MNAQELSLRHLMEQGNDAVQRPAVVSEVAQRQFVRNLERQARKEQEDKVLYARWVKRQKAVRRDIERERFWLFVGAIFGLFVGVVCFIAVIQLLMTWGLSIMAAIVISLIVGGGSGCGCTITVTHVCGH